MGLPFDLDLLKEKLENLVSIFLPEARGSSQTMCLVIRKPRGTFTTEVIHLFCDEPVTFKQAEAGHLAVANACEFDSLPVSGSRLSERRPGAICMFVSGERTTVSFAGMADPRADEYIALWVLSQVLEHDDENFLKIVERANNPYVWLNGGFPLVSYVVI